MILLIIGVGLLIFGIVILLDKCNYTKVKKGVQSYICMPQPVILKNGEMILAQINMSYEVINLKKAKTAIKNNINIFRKLEYEAITQLRKIADEVDLIQYDIIKLENNLKNRLFEIGQELGVEMVELHIKLGYKDDFNINYNIYN